MFNLIYSIFIFIITLGVLITIHELGHFLSARYFGVHVKQFSIGFGKKIYSFYDTKGTEYILSLIPLGGFIKMLDDRNIKNFKTSVRNNFFSQQSLLRRFLIIISGPLANLALAFFIYFAIFIYGFSSIRPIVGEVIQDSIAWKVNIIPGMEFKTIDGIKTPDWETVRTVLVSKLSYKKDIIITLYEKNNIVKKSINLYYWNYNFNIKNDPIISIGVKPYIPPYIEVLVGKVKNNSPAKLSGIKHGDKIVKINNKNIKNWQDFIRFIQNNSGELILIEVERQGQKIHLKIIPKIQSNGQGFIGIYSNIINIPDQYKKYYKYSPIIAAFESLKKTLSLIKMTVCLFIKLIIGHIKLYNISGPVSIAKGATLSASYGAIYYLGFLALISINLGIVNLLPLPSLDGGHILFLLIERIKGNSVSTKTQKFFYKVGSIFILFLMAIALFNDFSRV